MILPSDFALQRHRDQGIDGRMEVLPSLVPVDDGAVPGDTPPVPERPYFFYAGRLEKLKGVQDLIDLFRDYRGADLLIAGDGAYEDQLRGQARGLDHVRFLGRLHPSALGRFYSRAVAVLVPSLCYETFGLSAAEALAHGTPAIVRGIGAVAEVVEQQGAGLTFTTLPECRGAMEKLLHDTALRATLGERGREAWRQNWSTEIHLRRYLSLIEDLAEDKPALSGEGP
jgi:glycosyltransferase involved in cell wall biosynthesis